MAKRRPPRFEPFMVPEDTRPIGTVKFASPLGSSLETFHTFDDPPSGKKPTGNGRGYRPLQNSEWNPQAITEDMHRAHNRKRGVEDDDGQA